MMTNVVTSVLATVNAPYGASVSAHQLAAMIADLESVSNFSAPVFAFFSEVNAALQAEFVDVMGIDKAQVAIVANHISELSGYPLPLAA